MIFVFDLLSQQDLEDRPQKDRLDAKGLWRVVGTLFDYDRKRPWKETHFPVAELPFFPARMRPVGPLPVFATPSQKIVRQLPIRDRFQQELSIEPTRKTVAFHRSTTDVVDGFGRCPRRDSVWWFNGADP